MKVLVVEDDRLFQEELRDVLADLPGVEEIVVASTGAEGLAALATDPPPDAVLLDVTLPRDEDEATAGKTSVLGPELALEARRRAPRARLVVISGMSADDAVRLLLDEVVDESISKEAPVEELRARLRHQLRAVAVARGGAFGAVAGRRLVGSSPEMQEVRAWIEKVAPSPAPVLVTGESGCGKELVAWTLHRRSPWARGPFVPFHAAAVGDGLLESELFGHRQGAFTGASANRAGVVEAAQGGTLFMDEIGELPEAFQVKLLRFLDSGTFHRLGEDRPRQARVRLVFATNRDLAAEVEAGRFRRDLLYRLDVLRVHAPPLRERPQDLREISDHLLGELSRQQGRRPPRLGEDALEVLARHAWPGNVRELRNVLERALLLGEGEVLGVETLVLSPASPAGAPVDQVGTRAPGDAHASEVGSAGYAPGRKLKEIMAELERAVLEAALRHHGGNATQTARSLGIGRRTIHEKLARHGLRGE